MYEAQTTVASPTVALNDLLETAVALGHTNQKVQDLHQERLVRLEGLCFHGNGDSFSTQLRLIAQEIARVEERRIEAVQVVEDRLQRQMNLLMQKLDAAEAKQQAMAVVQTQGRWALITGMVVALIALVGAWLKK